jgi:quercetin 2,3-dioxygenase
VYPVFANLAFTNEISPMLMFDYGAPQEFPINPKKPRGVGKHPHRGFETVTIAFQGEVEHRDSNGGHGIIQAGDIQWMTAGRGIVHEEYHSKSFSETGGTFEMCQLWVNLPQKYKMVQPRYQAITNDRVPVVTLIDGATARIIAGSLQETHGPAKTYSPIQLWDISIPNKKTVLELPYPHEHACMIFVRRGSIQIGDDDSQILGPQDVAILTLNTLADVVRLTALQNDSAILIMGGEPLNEPIAHRGPFVMNTDREIHQAIMDYQTNRF